MNFEKGARVRFIGDKQITGRMFNFPTYDGCQGTVLGVAHSGGFKDLYNVRWDHAMENLHTCDGQCEEGYGWCSYGADLVSVDEPPDPDTKKPTRYDIALGKL